MTAPRFSAARAAYAHSMLLLTLALSPVLGLLTPYAMAVLSIGAFLAAAADKTLMGMYRNLPALLFLVAFALLAGCFAINAKSPTDMMFSLNFMMLVLFAPMAAALTRLSAPGNTERAAALAFTGVVLAMGMTLLDMLVHHDARPGGLTSGPILISNTAILLGYICLIGIPRSANRWRWLYLLGPLLGIGIALLTGSRGPLLGVPALSLIAVLAISKRRSAAVGVVVGGVAVAAAVVFVAARSGSRLGGFIEAISSLAKGAPVGDETTRIRLILYEAGWKAFRDSPWIGHGWANLMGSIRPYLSAANLQYDSLPHLHNDLLDFAVVGGVAGIGIYLLLLVTPVIAAWRSTRDSQYGRRLLGCVLLSVGYIFAGLTDLMFGFELHTALYVALSAVLLGYCRDAPMAPGRAKTHAEVATNEAAPVA